MSSSLFYLNPSICRPKLTRPSRCLVTPSVPGAVVEHHHCVTVISKDMLIVHCDHNDKGGGVALIGNKNLNPKQIRINTILKIVAVKIHEPIQMIVESVYRPPSTPIDVLRNHMLEIIAQSQHYLHVL